MWRKNHKHAQRHKPRCAPFAVRALLRYTETSALWVAHMHTNRGARARTPEHAHRFNDTILIRRVAGLTARIIVTRG